MKGGGLDDRFINLSRQYGLQPLYLHQILLLRNQGLNNSEIASRTGIARGTVNSYIEKVKEVERDDLLRLLGFVVLASAGAALLNEIFGK